MTARKNRKTIEKFVDCLNNHNMEDFYELFHDDYIEEYPQSGERIRGKDNLRKVYENFKDLPEVKAYSLECSGNLGVLEMLLDYPQGGTYNACEIIKFKNGKITHLKAYFAQPFEAADWRSEWVEMMGETQEETSRELYDETPRPRA